MSVKNTTYVVNYDKNQIEQEKNRILTVKEALLSIDESDFETLGEVHYHVGFQQAHLDVDEIYLEDIETKSIPWMIFHITSYDDMKIADMDRVLKKIKTFFPNNIEIIYGFALEEHRSTIAIDLFF